MKTHKDLDIWNTGIGLVEEVYCITKAFPSEEQFGITAQMRRAAVSVPANIAEGAARSSRKEFVKFLYVSLGSLSELETELIIAEKLNYIRHSAIFGTVEDLRKKMLNFIRYQKSRIPSKGS